MKAKYDRWKFTQVNLEDVRLREWRFGVGYGRDRSWHGQLNAEGIAAPPSPVLFNIATRRRNWVKVECSHEGGGRPRFQLDTAVIVHLTVYQPTRIALRAEGLFQKRCHEQRNHVHARCASAPVSCHLSLFPSFLLLFYSLPRFSISLFLRLFLPFVPVLGLPTLPISPLLFVHRLFVPDSWLHQMDTRAQFTQSTRARLGEWSASTCQSKAPQRCHVDKAIHDTIVKPLSRQRRDQHGPDLSSPRFQWPLSKW